MKPVVAQKKKHNLIWVLYVIIFIICILGIGISVYMQFYQDEKMGLIFGRADISSEEEDRYNDLKAEFSSLFTNNIERTQDENFSIEKLSEDYDIIVTAFSYESQEDNYKLNANIPQLNIKKEIPININKQIRDKFKIKAEEIQESENEENTIFTVSYIAYLQQDILSLVIRSELKEGTKNQKIEIVTFNYNLREDKEVSLMELLKLKGINNEDANKKILIDIEKVQSQNDALEEMTSSKGSLYKRDITSEIYKVENAKQFFLGKDGMLYIVYPYGNDEYTSEMDVIILK